MQAKPSVMFSVAKQIEGRFKRIESRVEADKGRTIVGLQLTQPELATLVGASRPTVSIALGELEDEGLVARTDGHLVVADPRALRHTADNDD